MKVALPVLQQNSVFGQIAQVYFLPSRQAGIKFRRQDRSLFARVRDMPIDVTFLRPDDMPVLCAEGAIDMGITGSDLVAEAGVDVATRMGLGVGACRLAVCVPDDAPFQNAGDLDGKRILVIGASA